MDLINQLELGSEVSERLKESNISYLHIQSIEYEIDMARSINNNNKQTKTLHVKCVTEEM